MARLIIFFVSILIIGCADIEIVLDCSDRMLTYYQMEQYYEQDIGCKFFLELHYFEGEEYFTLGNHCIDMIVFPVDCELNGYCRDSTDLEFCERFWSTAEHVGIIGVER